VYSTTWQAASVTWQREGVLGFYKGLLPSLLRVMPQSAITLMVYEGVVQLLEGGQDDGGGDSRAGAYARSSQQRQAAGGTQQDQQQQQQQQHSRTRRALPWRPRQALLTDRMSPLVLAADAQAEQ
jgi:hypothetical protein